MVVPFMFRRTTISVFIMVTPRMSGIALDYMALTGLGRILTVGVAGATAGEGVDGIEVKEIIMMPRRSSIAFMILVVSFFSGAALARDGSDRQGGIHRGASNGGHVRGEHVEGSRHRNYGEFEFFVGSPFFGPDFYYWPYYTYPPYYSSPTMIMPSIPPAYIDQGTVVSQIQPLGPSNLDYCLDPAGYYPYVKECSSGWRRINPLSIEQQPGYWYYCTNPAGYYPFARECSAIWRNVVP
jgi:hypothetical protein